MLMKKKIRVLCSMAVMSLVSGVALAQDLTIAIVGNGASSQMRELASDFTKKNPEIQLHWIALKEDILRRWVVADIATNRGQYDIITINAYELPIWAKEGWLISLDDLHVSYDVDDILPAIRDGSSVDGSLYAAPFYVEGAMVMYRKDLMKKAGLTMPKAPSWNFIRKAAKILTDKDEEIYGICVRGKAGWLDNVAFLTSMAHSFGAKWFDLEWNPQFDSDAWKETLNFYLDMMEESGPAEASSSGFSENFSLFQNGKCGIWIDDTYAASSVTNSVYSEVHGQVGFALLPHQDPGNRADWFWTWNLAIPVSSKKVATAKKFISWATSKDYPALLASKWKWTNAPPGTRASFYENPKYAKVPFAQVMLDGINSADSKNPAVEPVPYIGVHFVAIPEYQSIAMGVGQQFSDALAGRISADVALKNAQDLTIRIMRKAGYIKQ